MTEATAAPEQNADLEVVTTTIAEFSKVEAGITALKQKYAGVVFDVKTTKGMAEAVQARAAVRNPRLEVERLRKAAKAPVLAIGRKLDATAASITASLEAIEGPIHAQIQAEEARKEAEKQERIRIETERVKKIADEIGAIQAIPPMLIRAGSKALAEAREALESRGLTVEVFQERLQDALDAKANAMRQLDELHEAAVAREAEAARLKAEQEEAARLRAQEAEEQRQAAARLAEQQAALDRQREAQEAAAAKLAEDQAAFQKQQDDAREAARIAALPPPPSPAPVVVEAETSPLPTAELESNVLPFDAPARRPTAGELVEAVANDFGVNPLIAWDWLRTTSFSEHIELSLAA